MPQGRATRRHFTFYAKLPSILSCCQPFFNFHALIANSEKYTLADYALSINGSKKGWDMHLHNF